MDTTLIKVIGLLAITGLLLVCLVAEQKSRKWYDDRFLLRLQGFLVGCALLLIFL